jgi:hypothetical protein
VFRTGATEVLEKLPVHFDTTLRCVPDHIIYSDFEEDVQGRHIYDALDEISDTLKNTVPEFELYNHLRAHGREGLNSTVQFGSGPAGAIQNPGWKLDKWKFLPMVNKALRHRPDAKWFVFIEPDTYIMWPNLLKYLAKFDPSEPHYIGKHMYIGDVLFAHGGSGFALSNTAVRRVTEHWSAHVDEYAQYTNKEWAGDVVLGRTLRDVDIHLFWAFPHFQGDAVSALDHNITKVDKKPWCFAPVTYHHMRQEEVRMLWKFEQDWHLRAGNSAATMRHRDVFKEFILPHLPVECSDWDNLSIGTEYSEDAFSKLSDKQMRALSQAEKEGPESFQKCKAICESKPSCLQFSYAAGKCSISNEFRQGYKATSQCLEYSNAAGGCLRSKMVEGSDGANAQIISSVRSGWMIERLSDYVKEMDISCDAEDGNDWVT